MAFTDFPLDKSAHLVKATLQDYIDRTYPTIKDIILALPGHEEWIAYFAAFQSQ